jgi:hypothetical protein
MSPTPSTSRILVPHVESANILLSRQSTNTDNVFVGFFGQGNSEGVFTICRTTVVSVGSLLPGAWANAVPTMRTTVANNVVRCGARGAENG